MNDDRIAVPATQRNISLKKQAYRIAESQGICYESALEKIAIDAGFTGTADLRRAALNDEHNS